jgi:hypothetical protein
MLNQCLGFIGVIVDIVVNSVGGKGFIQFPLCRNFL